MKTTTAAWILAGTIFTAASAYGQATFTVGQHVTISQTGRTGTIIQVGQKMGNGGTMLKVHLDSLPAGFPNVGAWYDSMVSQVVVDGGGAALPAAPAPAAPPPQAPPPPPQAVVPPPAPMPAPAAAPGPGGFSVGEHVTIGQTGQTGTVISVGQQMGNGGTMLKIHLDTLPPGFDQIGGWYDSVVSQVSGGGGGAAPAPAAIPAPAPQGAIAPPAPPPQQAVNAPPPAPQPTNDTPPGNVAVSAQSCQQAIRANFPQAGADTTQIVNFQNFSMGTPQSYNAVYAGDLQAPYGQGHTVQATPIDTQFSVTTRYTDPNADDVVQNYTAKYMCYRTATTGEVITEEVQRTPAGFPTYAHKN